MDVNYEELKALRKMLHQHPELSGYEEETSGRIIRYLKKYNPDELITGVGGYGILATWNSGKEGKELVFRAELDALPIEEINEFQHKSTITDVAHKCGHDGHSTILCGLAQYLHANKPASGKVTLLFQPAEENGEGAKAMMADPKFLSVKPDFIFALHNLPGYPVSDVVIKENNFTAAVTSIIINLHGKTSHAAEPEHGYNPALCVSDIIRECLKLEKNDSEKEDMRVITPVYIKLGEKAYGVSAGKASVHFTIRCWTDENLNQLKKDIIKISREVAQKQNLKVDFDYTQSFHANKNDKTATDVVRKAALKKQLQLQEKNYPFKWGEDFGLFTTHFKGCMFGIGSGENCPALHNPDYDFPDKLIETGVNIFSGIINEFYNKDN